ncbi:flagellar basal body P-ring protein FlgI, partial [Vibrio sp. 10N.261.45.A7]
MKKLTLVLFGMLFLATSAHAARIKDVAKVAGVRSNQLVGYGLVTGLPGTGETTPFTDQTFNA